MDKRAELKNLLRDLHDYYAVVRDKEHQRRLLINWISLLICIFFLGGLLLIKLGYGPTVKPDEAILKYRPKVYFPVVAFVIWAAFIGAFASVLIRLANIPSRTGDSTLVAEIETVAKTLYSGPILGAVFSLVLYVAFCGQIIDGKFFPKMASLHIGDVDQSTKDLVTAIKKKAECLPEDCTDPTHSKIREYLYTYIPIDAQSFALLLVWSFIAGYSQTFVPDRLKAITSKANTS